MKKRLIDFGMMEIRSLELVISLGNRIFPYYKFVYNLFAKLFAKEEIPDSIKFY